MDLIKAFLVVQVIGVPAALIFGWLGNRWGAVRMIAIALVGYIFLTLLGSQIQPGNLTLLNFTFPSVWLIAAGVGMVQGGVQALSRSYFAELVPPGREVVYFGFYSMMGKFAAFIGPLLGAFAGWAFANPTDETSAERIGFASFALLFILGLILLTHSHRVNKVK
jgi:UMF1 family MFS transporter